MRIVLTAALALVAAAVARETAHSLHQVVPSDWLLVGDAAIHDSFVRLVPDRQSKKGALWNLNPVTYENWEITYEVRVHGVSLLGADGLAFWYAREPAVPGDLYGSKELFQGFSLILDTYDNDKTGIHPYVFGMWNDGTYKFDHAAHDHKDHTAGRKEGMEIGELNGCTVRLRNLRFPTTFKVSYVRQQLKVLYSLQPGSAWTQCFSIDRIVLPTGYYFGWSAATGDLADDHDVNITVVDPFDSAQSYGVQPAAPVAAGDLNEVKAALDRTARTLQAKMDGLLDVVSDTLKNVRNSGDMGSVQSTLRTIQAHTSTIAVVQSGVADLQATLKTLKGSSGGSSFGWLSTILVLGLGALSAYLAFELRRERRSKKLF